MLKKFLQILNWLCHHWLWEKEKKYFVMLVTKNDQTWQSYLVKSF